MNKPFEVELRDLLDDSGGSVYWTPLVEFICETVARELCDQADELDGCCGCADPLFDRAQELAAEYVAQRYGQKP